MLTLLRDRLIKKCIDDSFPYLKDEQERVKMYYKSLGTKNDIDFKVAQMLHTAYEIELLGFTITEVKPKSIIPQPK